MTINKNCKFIRNGQNGHSIFLNFNYFVQMKKSPFNFMKEDLITLKTTTNYFIFAPIVLGVATLIRVGLFAR